MELVSRCVECGLAEPESLASLGGSAPGVVDGILSYLFHTLFYLLLPLGYPLYMPPNFFIFTTHLHDPILRLQS